VILIVLALRKRGRSLPIDELKAPRPIWWRAIRTHRRMPPQSTVPRPKRSIPAKL
jgi:hypothetical protein